LKESSLTSKENDKLVKLLEENKWQ
jgi:hypothetical protein